MSATLRKCGLLCSRDQFRVNSEYDQLKLTTNKRIEPVFGQVRLLKLDGIDHELFVVETIINT